jgi:hypothetical protein
MGITLMRNLPPRLRPAGLDLCADNPICCQYRPARSLFGAPCALARNLLDKAAGLKQVFILCHGSTGSIAFIT